MFWSIRKKILVAVVALILLIQVVSTALQSYQIRSIFTEEFILGAQNLSQSVIRGLHNRLGDDIKEVTTADGLKEDMNVFMVMIQFRQFEPILKSKNDLLQMQFINFKGDLLVSSSKNGEGFEHFNIDKHPDMKAAPDLVELAGTEKLSSLSTKGRIIVAIPVLLNKIYQGSLVLTFSNQRLNAAEKRIYLVGATLVVFFMIIASGLIFLFIRSVLTRPIQQMIELMNHLAEGNLNNRFEVTRQDEIGKIGISVNQLIESLTSVFRSIENVMGGVKQGDLSRDIDSDLKGDFDVIKEQINESIRMLGGTIHSVKGTSESVERSSRELSLSAQNLSESSSRQAATLEEISSSIAEIENHSRQNSETAMEAQHIADETLQLVNQGDQQMEEMQASMDQINETSQKVTKIIKVIDEIAFQTNLLALNAAVEAARAGKYGKGFAVVAEEVRNLAARSAEAARNTSELIESSVSGVTEGVEKAGKTSTILKEIVGEMQKFNELAKSIADASREQTAGITEIYTGISQVNDSVQQNSAISEETSSASEVLLNQSATLQQEIARFKLVKEDAGLQAVQSVHEIEWQSKDQ